MELASENPPRSSMPPLVLATKVSSTMVVSCPSIPPPPPVPMFDTKVLLVTVLARPSAMMAPPPKAELPWNVLPLTVMMPTPSQSDDSMAPPPLADPPLKVEPVATRLPVRGPRPIHPSAMSMAPPAKSALLLANVSLATVSVPDPRSSMAPPDCVPVVAFPPLMVILKKVTVPTLVRAMVTLLPDPPSSSVGWVAPVPSMSSESPPPAVRLIVTISW
jgi:hypothetical protein